MKETGVALHFVKFGGVTAWFLLAFATPSGAQQGAWVCSSQTLGQQVCQAEGVCRCIFGPSGTMTRDPGGYRWQCSLLYGRCAPGSVYPLLARNAPATGNFHPAARDRREMVSSIQQDLRRLGFDPGPVDGIEGDKTKAAIRRYEETAGLPVTGTLSPLLVDRLRTAQPARR